MRYTRDTTLLPLSPADLRLVEWIPFREMAADGLLLFGESVSDFLFEFEPQEDIERFLQHAHFAGISAGRLVACREDLIGVAAIQTGTTPHRTLAVRVGSELPKPLRFDPVAQAFAAIRQGGEWRGMITLCSCGIGACFSQYAWVRDSVCIALFTIDNACLTEVQWLPFRFEVSV
ncbi:MAG TPA: hypothetical protein VM533_00220 [Fimbriiglobus sp.]|jgi:hypothetical protein|nr:hypothetical protein [Fimbriiglobus sp.]